MKASQKFNNLNKDFYQQIAVDFDDTRSVAWDGWKLLKTLYLSPQNWQNGFRVLDLGCGNARFFDFLKTEFKPEKALENQDGRAVEYTGIDYTKSLLDLAEGRYAEEISLIEDDILENSWPDQLGSQKFDLVVLFGVMHHISDQKDRLDLFKRVKQVLKSGGLFVFTTWEFLKNPRLAKKVLDLDSEDGQNLLKKYDLDLADFQTNDYILDWQRGQKAFRYAHFYEEREILSLLYEVKLEPLGMFLADGNDCQTNKYWVVRGGGNKTKSTYSSKSRLQSIAKSFGVKAKAQPDDNLIDSNRKLLEL